MVSYKSTGVHLAESPEKTLEMEGWLANQDSSAPVELFGTKLRLPVKFDWPVQNCKMSIQSTSVFFAWGLLLILGTFCGLDYKLAAPSCSSRSQTLAVAPPLFSQRMLSDRLSFSDGIPNDQ